MLKGIWVTSNLDKLGINKGSGRQLSAGLVVEKWTGVESILDIRFATTGKSEKGFIKGMRDHKDNAGFLTSENSNEDNPLKTIIGLVDKKNQELKVQNDVDGTKWDLWLTDDPTDDRFNLMPRVGQWHDGKFYWQDEEV